MSKKALKVAAILVSVCFILTMAPVLNSAEKKPTKLSILSFLKQPLVLLSAMLHIIPPVIDDSALNNSMKELIPANSTSKGIVKTTGDENVNPPIKHD